MADLISRQAAIELLNRRLIESANNNVGCYEDAGVVFEEIATERLKRWMFEIPSADAVSVRHGHWEECEVLDENCVEVCQSARCSICGRYHTTPYMYYFDQYKYCPNCGARMDGET